MNVLTAFIKLFIVADEPDSKDHQAVRAHRKAVVAWRQWMGWSQVILWGFFWWSIGMGTVLGMDMLGQGFARAETVNRIEVQLLAESILQDRIRHCNASSEDSRAYFYRVLEEKLQLYEKLTGREYKLPACSDLAGVR